MRECLSNKVFVGELSFEKLPQTIARYQQSSQRVEASICQFHSVETFWFSKINSG